MKRSAVSVIAASTDADHPLGGLEIAPAVAPQPRRGDTVVEIEAAAVNHHDLWTLRGVGAVPVALPRVLGSDGAGSGNLIYPAIVCGDVERCRGCRIGDATLCRRLTMIGEGRDGTMSRSVAVPASSVVRAPRNLAPTEAAALPSAYSTAFSMLFRAVDLDVGAPVLVTGASGGVGVAAIQLGAAAGFDMVARVRHPVTAPTLERLGAALVIGSDDNAVAEYGCEFAAVVETVGAATWSSSLRALRPGGTVVVAGATSGDPPADLRRIFWRRLSVVGVSLSNLDDFVALVEFVERHDIHPEVAAVYPMADAEQAFERLYAGGVVGKIVLTND